MGQEDRFFYNILFEMDEYENIHLANIFDYELSFGEINEDTSYLNLLYSFCSLDDYHMLMNIYPHFMLT